MRRFLRLKRAFLLPVELVLEFWERLERMLRGLEGGWASARRWVLCVGAAGCCTL